MQQLVVGDLVLGTYRTETSVNIFEGNHFRTFVSFKWFVVKKVNEDSVLLKPILSTLRRAENGDGVTTKPIFPIKLDFVSGWKSEKLREPFSRDSPLVRRELGEFEEMRITDLGNGEHHVFEDQVQCFEYFDMAEGCSVKVPIAADIKLW